MSIGEFCNREVVFATRKTNIIEAAQLMRRYHVGDLVVVDEVDGQRVPVGLVTDRDIVVEVVAKDCPAGNCAVESIMSAQLISVEEQAGVITTIRLMRTHGIRRIPVVNGKGGLVGIVSGDDMLDLLADELAQLAKVSPREQVREVRSRIS